MSAVGQEPVVTASTVLAVIGGVLGYATSHGLITSTQASGWTQLASTLVPVALPLVVGWITRAHTRPLEPPPPEPKAQS